MAELKQVKLNGDYYNVADTLVRGYFENKDSQLATTGAHGFMSSTDKTKLDGIEAATTTSLGLVRVGNGLAITDAGVLSVHSTGLPIASDTTLGAIKVGNTLSIDSSTGELNAIGYDLPTASDTVLGGIKVGTNLNIADGVLSVNDSTFVHKSGDETIAGTKTFSTDIAGNITGNAATATKLQTARSISLTGPVTGSANFDGSNDVSISTTLTLGDLYDVNISEKVSNLSSITADTTLDGESASVFILTLGADNLTLTPSFTKAGCKTITAIINNPSTYTVNWGGTIKWPSGTAPTLTANTAMITLLYANSVWYGISVTDLQ